MRERPILFSAPMVRAILDGTKTQTRRVVKGLALDWLSPPISFSPEYVAHTDNAICPYGQPGDRLWVRETWRETSEGRAWHYAADGTVLPKQRDTELQAFLAHRAPFTWESYKWRPSIHMPRAASRITLEVTCVRVERLQDISEADAIAEGVERVAAGDGWRHYTDPASELAGPIPHASALGSYRSLWESINGQREPKHIRRRRSKGKPVHRAPQEPGSSSWDANPWVWVVEFRRVGQEGGAA